MLKRTLTYVVPVIVLVSAAGIVDASLVSAFTRPTMSLTIPRNHVHADAPFRINFASTGLPGGSILSVQQQGGAAHAWKNVARLDGSSGSTIVSGTPMGLYEYRISAIKKTHAVAASEAKSLYSYGDVTMMALCRALHARCSGGSEQIGAKMFAFAEGFNAPGATYPHYETLFGASHTSCRGATITFATYTPGHPGEAYLRLLQHESEPEPEEASTSATAIGRTDVAFNGGPWYLESSSSDGNNDVINGTFSCYTPTGL